METEAEEYHYWMPKERRCKMNAHFFVFVYGTLKKNQGNHHLLADSKFIGVAKTKDSFLLFGSGFPLARLPNEDENKWLAAKLKGELYRVSSKVLKVLDRLEGHPDFYKRQFTILETHKKLSCYMYHWNDRNGTIPREIVHAVYVNGERVHDWQ